MLNQISIMGRLTKDPELRYTSSQTAVASFSVACERDYAAQGQNREVDFIEVVAWRGTGEFVSKYFRKGNMIGVTGRLQSRRWQDQNGNNRINWEINAEHCYFCGSKNENQGTTYNTQDNRATTYQNNSYAARQQQYGNPNVYAPSGWDSFEEMPGPGADNPFTQPEYAQPQYAGPQGTQASFDDLDEGELPF